MKMRNFSFFLAGVFMISCTSTSAPPVAAEKPHTHQKHGDKRFDPYFWLKERENPEVIKYLEAENAYFAQKMKPVESLKEKLYQEMRARLKEDDSSVPFRKGQYFYYSRYETGKEYPIYARKKGNLEAAEEILLNVNDLAKGHDYFFVPFPNVSPDHTKLIYAADSQGRRFYDLHVVEIATGKELDKVAAVTADTEWANDNQTFFYVKQHPETLRAQFAYRRKIGDAKDTLLFEEKDETFNLGLGKSRNNDFIFLQSGATLSSEWRFLDANKPLGNFSVFLPREKDHEYSIEDGGDGFYVLSNWKAKNFRLLKAPRRAVKKEEWVEVIPHKADVLLTGVDYFSNWYAVSERSGGLSSLRVVNRKSGEGASIPFPDPTYVAMPSTNAEYNSATYRYAYESLNRPDSIYEYNFATGKSVLLKTQETPTLDPSLYVSERQWAKARDGTLVPISILYKKGFEKNGKAPILQYAYGSYGFSMDPYFSTDIFSLVDRGFLYAIAHVRGGSDMGRSWYEGGKLFTKLNTFTDFIDATEFLVKEGYGDSKRIYAQGGSAGGLLIGAVANLRPDLYRAMHAAVPFVDVLTTMLDDSIPLTTGEYDEWGNPNDPKYYAYMKSYSPYDNVAPKAYPHLLVTTGLHDSQVQYWEPAKWVARLRKVKQGDSLLLLRTEMEAGHGGASGRFEALKETADEYAFFLMMDQKDK
jgi:oligopeptidase B